MRQDPSHACPSEQLLQMIRAVFTCRHQLKRERAMTRKRGQGGERPLARETRCFRSCNNLILTAGENVSRYCAMNGCGMFEVLKKGNKKKPDADIFCKHIFISAKVKQDFQKMNPEISAKGLHHITTNFTVNIIWGWCITSGTVHPKKNKRIMLLFIQLHVVSKPLFNDRRLWSSKKDKNTINAP